MSNVWEIVLCVKGQACVLVLRAIQSREVQQLLSGPQWMELCAKVTGQLAAVSQHRPEFYKRVEQYSSLNMVVSVS